MKCGLWMTMALLAGCSGSVESFVLPELSSDVEYLVALVLPSGSNPDPVTASGLHKVDEPIELELEALEDESSILVLGYTSASLSMFELPEASLRRGPLSTAVACETSLPSPAEVVALQGQPPMSLPPLTSSWLRDACLPLLEPGVSGLIDLCVSTYCGQTWTQRGCRVDLEISGCVGAQGLPSQGWLTSEGGLCLPEEGCQSHPRVGAPLSAQCSRPGKTTCDISLELPGTLEGELVRVSVGSVEPPIPDLNLSSHRIQELGHLTALGARDGRVFVGYRAAFSGGPGEIVVLDADTLEVSSRVPGPDGLQRIVPDPHGDGFLAAHVDPTGHLVARFDRDGQRVSAALLPAVELPSQSYGIFVTDGGDKLVLHAVEQRTDVHRFFTLDARSLAVLDTCALPPLSIDDVALLPSGEVFFYEDDSDEFGWLDVRSCQVADRSELPLGGFAGGRVIAVDGRRALAVIYGAESPPALYLVEPATELHPRAYFEAFGRPGELSPRAAVPGTFWVTMMDSVDSSKVGSRLTRFDTRRPGFVVGSVELGKGTVGDAVEDDQGRVWLTLPWSAEVLRFTPRDPP